MELLEQLLINDLYKSKLEIVIVDGGSNDGTLDYLKNQTFCTNWVSEKDKGIYDAMNKGIEMSNGEYLWFLNSGDYAYNQKSIDLILENIDKKADAIYGETMLVDEKYNEIGVRSIKTTRKLPSTLNWKSFKFGMNVGHQSFVVKKNISSKYNTEYKHVSDIDWMINCLKKCNNIVNLNHIVSCFTLDGHSTKYRKASNKERYEVLKKHYGFFPNILHHLVIVLRSFLQPAKI